MKNSKIIVALGIIAMFVLALTTNVSAQDSKKKETLQVKAPKQEVKVKGETPQSDDAQEEGELGQQDDDKSKLKKYKKKKGKKAKKAKKEYKGKGNAYGRDKDKEGREFGKERSDKAKKKKDRSGDDRPKGLSDDEKVKMESDEEASGKKAVKPEVAEIAPAKNLQEQIIDMESRIAKMKNVMATKDLSDDAKRKYNERISEYQKELNALKAKQSSIKGAEIE